MDCWEQYLNIETGEIVSLSDGTWNDRDEDEEALVDEIDTTFIKASNIACSKEIPHHIILVVRSYYMKGDYYFGKELSFYRK